MDRCNDHLAIGSTEQLQRPTASIDRYGGAADADSRSPHLDDRTGIDHDVDVAWNIKGRAIG